MIPLVHERLVSLREQGNAAVESPPDILLGNRCPPVATRRAIRRTAKSSDGTSINGGRSDSRAYGAPSSAWSTSWKTMSSQERSSRVHFRPPASAEGTLVRLTPDARKCRPQPGSHRTFRKCNVRMEHRQELSRERSFSGSVVQRRMHAGGQRPGVCPIARVDWADAGAIKSNVSILANTGDSHRGRVHELFAGPGALRDAPNTIALV
jgi:hypothetical protein